MKNLGKIKKIGRKVIKYVFRALLILLVLYNVIYVIGHEYDKTFNIKIFGMSAAVVESDSMKPDINKKDVVIIKKEQNLIEGDVIAFYQQEQLKIRRIARVNEDSKGKTYLTKGDNYFYYDAKEMNHDQVEGKVIKVLKKSGIIVKLFQSKGLVIFNTIILVPILLYNKKLEQRRKKRKRIKDEYVSK